MDTQELKKAGLKATLPRLRILEILEGTTDRHMSAEDVYKALIDAGEDVAGQGVPQVATQHVVGDVLVSELRGGLVERHRAEV